MCVCEVGFLRGEIGDEWGGGDGEGEGGMRCLVPHRMNFFKGLISHIACRLLDGGVRGGLGMKCAMGFWWWGWGFLMFCREGKR